MIFVILNFRETLCHIMAITPLLGITWIFGVLSVNQDLIAFQYIFAVANSLQVRFKYLINVVILFRLCQF